MKLSSEAQQRRPRSPHVGFYPLAAAGAKLPELARCQTAASEGRRCELAEGKAAGEDGIAAAEHDPIGVVDVAAQLT
jgi:hypothetical protein